MNRPRFSPVLARRLGGTLPCLGRLFDQLWSDERVLWADESDELDAVWRAISARDGRSRGLWTDDYLAAFARAGDLTLGTPG